MKKILLFQMKTVCYDSYRYFSNALSAVLERAGFCIEIYDRTREPLEALNRYQGLAFDAMIDFNSDLPKLMLEEGGYYLDSIDAPFYDIILDHPLYHHDMLKAPLQNFHVICLDRNHQQYIRENYPHIKTVDVLPMTGEPCPFTTPTTKMIELLFTGTYTPSADIESAISDCPAFFQKDMRQIIAQMKTSPSLTLESCMQKLAKTEPMILEDFPLHMQAFFLVDSYIRAYEREQVLSTILDAGLPLTLCGEGWEQFLHHYEQGSLPYSLTSPKHHGKFLSSTPENQVSILPAVAFGDSFLLMKRAKITLNIMPHFTDGTHDRIYSSMLNQSLCVTDATPMLQEQFANGQDLYFYSKERLGELPTLLEHLLTDDSTREEITTNGYKKASAHHTWVQRGEAIISILNL